MRESTIRIGGASGYWGDDPTAAAQLLQAGDLDYLVFDYLAEVTLSIMARARSKDPSQGYARDFVDVVMRRNLPEIAHRQVRVISNAGGVNPQACAQAVRDMVAEMGLELTVAVVLGDDLTDRASDLNVREMFTGEPVPDPSSVFSINAYLGAFPIARALTDGADIVITGRCVDSAVTLGACIHAFNWDSNDHDRLAAGTLAGHILECGTQATGGNFTDWHLVADSLDRLGYPICEITADGTIDISKPEGTGGLVSIGTIAEQMLYEIADPQTYVVPDVVCDFSRVTIAQIGQDKVRLSGARGHPPTPDYKVSLTYLDGWRAGSTASFYGSNAASKAQSFCDAVFARARSALRQMNLSDYTETSVEIIGAGSQMGNTGLGAAAQEVVAKFAARHPDKAGLEVLLRAASGMGLSAPPGLSGFFGTRARPSPLVRLFSFLVSKGNVPVTIDFGTTQVAADIVEGTPLDPAGLTRPAPPPRPAEGTEDMVSVPLEKLAWGRSGDKGDTANIGIIARHPDALPYIWHTLDQAAVSARFAHVLEGEVSRYLLPGCNGMNVVLTRTLGGGGVASLRNDALGKGFAQILLQTPVRVPRPLAEART